MHGRAAQLSQIETMAASVHARPPVGDVLICLPATLLSRAVQAAAGRLAIGGEECHAEDSGPFTGDISAGMAPRFPSLATRWRAAYPSTLPVPARPLSPMSRSGRSGAGTCHLRTDHRGAPASPGLPGHACGCRRCRNPHPVRRVGHRCQCGRGSWVVRSGRRADRWREPAGCRLRRRAAMRAGAAARLCVVSDPAGGADRGGGEEATGEIRSQ